MSPAKKVFWLVAAALLLAAAWRLEPRTVKISGDDVPPPIRERRAALPDSPVTWSVTTRTTTSPTLSSASTGTGIVLCSNGTASTSGCAR